MNRKINIGTNYLPGSIRARLGEREIPVEEVDPAAGTVSIDVPDNALDEVSLTFEKSLLRAASSPPNKVIGVADACVYCGSRSDLRDEHIIPFGLQGEFVLRKASCQGCEKKTSKIERSVLRHTLMQARCALNIRTRHLKQRPETLPVTLIEGGKETVVQVPVSEHPSYIALPLFEPPAKIRKADRPDLRCFGPWTRHVGGRTLDETGKALGGRAAVDLDIDPYEFAGMIGKIAHGFMMAANLGNVEGWLPDAVFGDDETIGWWVGGAPNLTLGTTGLHHVSCTVDEDGFIYVRVRLFAQLGGPEYLVLPGRIIDPAPGMQPSVTVEIV